MTLERLRELRRQQGLRVANAPRGKRQAELERYDQICGSIAELEAEGIVLDARGPRHHHDIEVPCEAAGCSLYDPKDWRCACGSPVMFADTEGDPRGPCCVDCADRRGERAA